jgi:hypothetical protein
LPISRSSSASSSPSDLMTSVMRWSTISSKMPRQLPVKSLKLGGDLEFVLAHAHHDGGPPLAGIAVWLVVPVSSRSRSTLSDQTDLYSEDGRPVALAKASTSDMARDWVMWPCPVRLFA